MAKAPLVYAIGIDSLMARAVYADLPGTVIQRRRILSARGPLGTQSHQPDLVLMELAHADPKAVLAAARLVWGPDVLIVGLRRDEPQAYVWKRQGDTQMVEIGPGFLRPFLPWAGRDSSASDSPEAQDV